MKYRVIKDYPTSDGMLYQKELVIEHSVQGGVKNHLRVKDSTGKIWFVPIEYLKKAWTFLKKRTYILMKLLMSLNRGR